MRKKKTTLSNYSFYKQIVELLQSARERTVHEVNRAMVCTYYEIGRRIVEEEQLGAKRAQYGKQLIEGLSAKLTEEIGKGFSIRNLGQMRQFYIAYSIPQTVSAESKSSIPQTLSAEFKKGETTQLSVSFEQFDFNLSWSHYLKLMRLDDHQERGFYEIEAHKNNWSVRELQRQCDSALFTRLAKSRNKQKVKELAEKGLIVQNPRDVIKDPYILEFIGLPEKEFYSETELEEEIISKLEEFLLELGTGFTFVGRQKRISIEEKHFYIDLVFYNRILRCFVLVDLKIGEIKHQDLGQMQMYVNYYDREVKLKEENKTLGIVLCQNKSEAVVEYTLPENNEQIFASKYKTILPAKEKLESLLAKQIS